ncbi:hypothetical protein EDB86DRAFT_1973788 [Lactarius hatsudake]|nr:hypothetical protein EDB86DRAFT_1973788 [Lactarius hatsudake]
MYIRSKSWPKVQHIVRFLSFFPLVSVYRDSGVLDSCNRMGLRDLLEASQFVFFLSNIYAIISRLLTLFASQIDYRLPCPPIFAPLLIPSLSSSKQTDFRNVVSHPHFRHGLFCTSGRRRRRRHLSYMRGCLHLQQQNYRSDSYSLPSDPKPKHIPNNPFAYSLCYGGTVENKTHDICRSSHSNPSSYIKSPYHVRDLQKSKQTPRYTQPTQAPWSSSKDCHPHKAARQVLSRKQRTKSSPDPNLRPKTRPESSQSAKR